MCVRIQRRRYIFMPHPVCDNKSIKPLVDQKRHMRMPDIMHAYFFHPCISASPLHFIVQKRFAKRKKTIAPLVITWSPHILHQLLTKKIRYGNPAFALLCLGRGDDIPSLQTLVRFINGDLFFLKINIPLRKRQQLCFCQVKTKKIFFFCKGKAPPKA